MRGSVVGLYEWLCECNSHSRGCVSDCVSAIVTAERPETDMKSIVHLISPIPIPRTWTIFDHISPASRLRRHLCEWAQDIYTYICIYRHISVNLIQLYPHTSPSLSPQYQSVPKKKAQSAPPPEGSPDILQNVDVSKGCDGGRCVAMLRVGCMGV